MSMASISSTPTPPHNKVTFPTPHKSLRLLKRPFSPLPLSLFPDSLLCRSSSSSSSDNNNNGLPQRRWDFSIQHLLTNAFKTFDSYFNSYKQNSASDASNTDTPHNDWDWDRWKTHFDEVDDHERLGAWAAPRRPIVFSPELGGNRCTRRPPGPFFITLSKYPTLPKPLGPAPIRK